MGENIYRIFDVVWKLSLVGGYCVLLVLLARLLLKKAQKNRIAFPCALPANAQNRRTLRLHRAGRRFVRFQQGAPEHPKRTD